MDCLDLTWELLYVLKHTNVFTGTDAYVDDLIKSIITHLEELQLLLEDELVSTIKEESDSDYEL